LVSDSLYISSPGLVAITPVTVESLFDELVVLNGFLGLLQYLSACHNKALTGSLQVEGDCADESTPSGGRRGGGGSGPRGEEARPGDRRRIPAESPEPKERPPQVAPQSPQEIPEEALEPRETQEPEPMLVRRERLGSTQRALFAVEAAVQHRREETALQVALTPVSAWRKRAAALLDGLFFALFLALLAVALHKYLRV